MSAFQAKAEKNMARFRSLLISGSRVFERRRSGVKILFVVTGFETSSGSDAKRATTRNISQQPNGSRLEVQDNHLHLHVLTSMFSTPAFDITNLIAHLSPQLPPSKHSIYHLRRFYYAHFIPSLDRGSTALRIPCCSDRRHQPCSIVFKICIKCRARDNQLRSAREGSSPSSLERRTTQHRQSRQRHRRAPLRPLLRRQLHNKTRHPRCHKQNAQSPTPGRPTSQRRVRDISRDIPALSPLDQGTHRSMLTNRQSDTVSH